MTVTHQCPQRGLSRISLSPRLRWTSLALGAALTWAFMSSVMAQTTPAATAASPVPVAPAATTTGGVTTSTPAAPSAVPSVAGTALPASPDPALEARVMKLSAELRCLVCQNQTIADSNAGLAVDLRNQVREMLKRGDTPEQITDYMTARYGDFVLYRPPVNSSTAVLWYGPAALLVLSELLPRLSRRKRERQ